MENPNNRIVAAGRLEGALTLYRKAAQGEDFRLDSFWPEFERMNTTTGHYFRGAE